MRIYKLTALERLARKKRARYHAAQTKHIRYQAMAVILFLIIIDVTSSCVIIYNFPDASNPGGPFQFALLQIIMLIPRVMCTLSQNYILRSVFLAAKSGLEGIRRGSKVSDLIVFLRILQIISDTLVVVYIYSYGEVVGCSGVAFIVIIAILNIFSYSFQKHLLLPIVDDLKESTTQFIMESRPIEVYV